jgi:superfamily II DNA/RNA helicase
MTTVGFLPASEYRRQHDLVVEGANAPEPMQTFESVGFPRDILDEIRRAGFSAPTPIQAQAWPIALTGRDLVAIAKTGSGKTCGFLLPGMLHIQVSISLNPAQTSCPHPCSHPGNKEGSQAGPHAPGSRPHPRAGRADQG